MKYNYPPLEGICGKCWLKCGRLEDPNFKGVWRCENYIEGESKDEYRGNVEINVGYVPKYR